jgi:vacuolar-type H+-ATPase subunit F/Vma7
MSTVAAIGAQLEIGGFGLAGARVYPADGAEQVRAAWRDLPDDVAVVILTRPAAEALAEALAAAPAAPGAPLTIVMPP